jgi:3-oxoacyl-[acyl-carrier protein] reductase
MKASTRQVDGVTIVDLSGRITLGEGSVVLRDAVKDLLAKGQKKISMNFRDVSYIDSSGIGELVSAFTSVRSQGGELKLLHLTQKVHDLLQTTKLDPAPAPAPPALSLDGKVALITGGSRGIGAASVRLFVRAGARVVFNYRQAEAEAQWLVEECGSERCHAVKADLTGTANAEALVRAAAERFGALDALVVNHGIWAAEAAIDQMSDERWHNTLAVNLDSAFAVTKHAVAQMKRQGRGGHIVFISSTAGQRGEDDHCDYAATKGALISMTKGLSTELAPFGIYVNCVAPGWVATPMTAGALGDPEYRAEIFAKIPLGRVATPEEIAAPILFLCTSYAGFITGEVFNVNGGAVLVG